MAEREGIDERARIGMWLENDCGPELAIAAIMWRWHVAMLAAIGMTVTLVESKRDDTRVVTLLPMDLVGRWTGG